MTAPRGFQKGSFRGVPFVSEGQEAEGGRRGVQHELPQGETPIWEDLGRKGGRWSLDAHIRGASYPAGADALQAALDALGPGTLVHPWLGAMQVAVESYTRVDTVADGQFARFSIQFVESGLAASAAPTSDTAVAARAEAGAARAATPDSFRRRFDLAGATAFVGTAADRLAQAASLAAALSAGRLGGAGGALHALDRALALVGAPGLARMPRDFARAVLALTSTVSAIGLGKSGRLGAIADLLGWGSDLPPVIGDTPARQRERANQQAIVQLVNRAAAIELVAAIAEADFASYQEAVALRDLYAGELDRVAVRQADAGDDEGAELIDRLRRAMVRDVTARGGSLARLQAFQLATTEPALVIAYRLYGRGDTIGRASDLIARNRVAHPGFVPGGRALQVLTPAGASTDAR